METSKMNDNYRMAVVRDGIEMHGPGGLALRQSWDADAPDAHRWQWTINRLLSMVGMHVGGIHIVGITECMLMMDATMAVEFAHTPECHNVIYGGGGLMDNPNERRYGVPSVLYGHPVRVCDVVGYPAIVRASRAGTATYRTAVGEATFTEFGEPVINVGDRVRIGGFITGRVVNPPTMGIHDEVILSIRLDAIKPKPTPIPPFPRPSGAGFHYDPAALADVPMVNPEPLIADPGIQKLISEYFDRHIERLIVGRRCASHTEMVDAARAHFGFDEPGAPLVDGVHNDPRKPYDGEYPPPANVPLIDRTTGADVPPVVGHVANIYIDTIGNLVGDVWMKSPVDVVGVARDVSGQNHAAAASDRVVSAFWGYGPGNPSPNVKRDLNATMIAIERATDAIERATDGPDDADTGDVPVIVGGQ